MNLELFDKTIFVIEVTLFVAFCFMFVTILSLAVKHKLNLK